MCTRSFFEDDNNVIEVSDNIRQLSNLMLQLLAGYNYYNSSLLISPVVGICQFPTELSQINEILYQLLDAPYSTFLLSTHKLDY